MSMQNDPNLFLDRRFSELDDPAFWEQVTSQVDVTALLHPDSPVSTPGYLSTPYQQPTTERLPVPRTRAIVPFCPDTTEKETSHPTDRHSPVATGQHTLTTTQNKHLPIILMGLLVILLMVVGTSHLPAPRSNTTFVDTTPQVAGTWDVHCSRGTPNGAGGTYSIVGPPTINAQFINQVFSYYNSPMKGQGQLFVEVSQYCGLDPASVLAFYMHESSFGLAGEARYSLSPGNLRCIPGFKCQDGYAWFDSWQDGLMVQCRLLRNLYVDAWGLTTPEQIIPKYAPAADNNNEKAYEYALEHAVDTWKQHVIAVS
jgi:hypothetical protein